MANHTSGLPRLPANLGLSRVDPENPYRDYDEEKLVEYLQNEMDLPSENIGKYQYSNLGAGLLGFTMSKISNQPYENLLEKEVFSKYEMEQTTTDRGKVNDLVKGRNKNGEVTKNWDMGSLAGAGAIISNVQDIGKFVIAHFDGKNQALTMTRKRTMPINETLSIGMGWHLR